jgi:hypothetical protein
MTLQQAILIAEASGRVRLPSMLSGISIAIRPGTGTAPAVTVIIDSGTERPLRATDLTSADAASTLWEQV